MNKRDSGLKIGVLIFGSPRYRDFGEGTQGGKYEERKRTEAKLIVGFMESIGDVVFPGVIYNREQTEIAMQQFYAAGVDFVVAQYLSWAEDFAWIRFLRDMPDIPVFFCCIIEDEYTFGDITNEDEFLKFLSACRHVGALQAVGSIPRVGNLRVKTFIGNAGDCLKEASVFGRAAKVRTTLKKSVFGLLPNYNEVMWSTYVDPYNLFTQVGPELKFIQCSRLAEEIKQIDDQKALRFTERLRANYRVEDGVENEKMIESVRASLGVERLARLLNLDVVVLNDIDPLLLSLLGLRPGFCPATFDDDAAVVVGEGDVGAALAVYILKLLSGGHVNFVEPFYVDKKRDSLVIGHAGPNDYTEAACKSLVRIAPDARFARSNYKYAGAPFAWYRIPAGEKTMLHISEFKSGFKVVCSLVESLEGEHFIPNYSHGEVKSQMPAIELFERFMEIGVTQHFGIVEGNYTKELEYLSFMTGFDYYHIS